MPSTVTAARDCCVTHMAPVGELWTVERPAGTFHDGCTITYQRKRCDVCGFAVTAIVATAPSEDAIAMLRERFGAMQFTRGWWG